MGKLKEGVAVASAGGLSFLSAPGELGALIALHDWAATPLGPLDSWPQSVRTSVNLMLNSRHPMWIGWGPGATFLYNDAYIEVLGQAKHPWALGRPAEEVWAEIWDFCGPLADKVFKEAEATFVDDVQLFMRRGEKLEETWYSFSYSPITDESGQVGGLFCPSTPVTSTNLNARRLATLSVLAASALQQSTLESACATAMRTLAANPADIPFALLYLADEQGATGPVHAPHLLEAAGIAHADQLPPPSSAHCPFPVTQVLASGGTLLASAAGLPGVPLGLAQQPVERALCLPLTMPGRERPIGVLVAGLSPVRPLDSEYRTFFELVAGQVAAAMQTAMAVEEQRRRADMLAELDRAKTAFFSNVSHEFRTPLTLMLGPIEDALGDAATPLPPVQYERLKLVQRNALRLQKLVNTLLDFSRVQAGRMHASFVEVDLPALTADLASAFRSVMESAGLELDVRCAPLEPSAYVDVSMWEKIVLNLLSNAFKFTFEGRIAVELRQDGEAAALTVSDTGVGIDPRQLPRVFERFQRVEGSRARTHEGSGIGLALVRDLVELHGGRIEADSTPGVGTRFTVTIPLGRAHLREEQVLDSGRVAPSQRAIETFTGEAQRWLPGVAHDPAYDAHPGAQHDASAPVVAGPLAAPRILVADDNADMRDYLVRLLGQRWHVTAVANGQLALAEARRERPDLILSDVMMPVLDGFGLIAQLRAEPRLQDVPVVLLSARAGEEARIEGLSAGADEYLVKPFSARELTTRVESLLLRARIRAVERAHGDRLRRVFQEAPAAIAIMRGPEHVFDSVNDRYLQLIGGRDVVGLPIRAALPESSEQDYIALLDRVWATGEPFVGHSLHYKVARNGTLEDAYFDFVYQPLHDAEGQVEGIAAVIFEVTELAQARMDAEVANRAKDEFLAMLGHELRNPLSPILIALELMRLKGVTGAEKEHAIIERQAQHLVRLVDDLLDVARIARGKIELRPERAELSRLVAQAVETVSPLLEERRHRLRLDVPNSGIFINADPMRFTQVLSNLLTNAAKYTNVGGSITVRVWTAGREAVVQVEDNGIGIDPDTLPSMFDKFVQERQALDRSRGGLGLGLAIVKSIVQLHGGSVNAYSEGEGKGSCFEVRVPLSAQQGSGAEAGPQLAQDAGAGQDGCSVLLVDDNPDVLEAMTALLELSGHSVVALPDPAAALKLPGSCMPQIAILDIGLPGMDGYELAQELARRPAFRHTRFVALSGYGQESDRERSQAAGFCAHLVKPVAASQLSALIESLRAPA